MVSVCVCVCVFAIYIQMPTAVDRKLTICYCTRKELYVEMYGYIIMQLVSLSLPRLAELCMA